jgi:hypothetical protein
MELRGLVNGVTSTVNPNQIVAVRRSTGYTIGAGQRQIPSYAPDVTGPAQIQALTGSDLRHLDGLNIQGTLKAIYLRGKLAGVVQPKQKGGDLIIICGEVWLVVQVLENWPTWTKAAIQYQGPQ